jgi:tRNA A-37 threonylcarbamoyl transferase component Bud32/tetratricopeptide (TPR) repeat protein
MGLEDETTASLDEDPARAVDGGLRPGEILAGRYRITRAIASGGMGAVYAAEDTVLHERIALKVLRPEVAADARAVLRFKREIQLARRVSHPNVCRVFELGQDGERLFLTMEFLDGETLSARLKRAGRLSPAAALPIVEQIARGLVAAHDAGVIHRDLKSANVMIVPGRDHERVVVTDFGLARDPASGGDVETTGPIVGSPGYMAPEQVLGGSVGPRTDVYAFGVVIFELVTGRLPFVGDTPLHTAVKRLREPPPAPRRFAPDLPVSWDDAILRCLTLEPRDRFGSAREVVTALGQRGRRRWRRWIAGAAVPVAVAGAALLWPGPAAVTGPVRRVLVVPPRGERWIGTAIAEDVAARLDGAADLLVIDPAEAAAALRDLELAPSDAYTAANLTRLARRTRADRVIAGSLVVSGDRLDVTLHAQDVASGATVARVPAGGRVDDLAAVGAALSAGLGAPAADPHALPSPPAIHAYVDGLTAARASELATARTALDQAAQLDPRSPRIADARATVLEALGDDAGARAAAIAADALSAELPAETRAELAARRRLRDHDPAGAAVAWQAAYVVSHRVDAGLAWARARAAAGDAAGALVVAAQLRQADDGDPRVPLLEAELSSFSDPERARAAVADAIAAARRIEARGALADALSRSAWLDWEQGALDAATRAGEEARSLHLVLGLRRNLANDLGVLGAVAWQRGRFGETARIFTDAVPLAIASGDPIERGEDENNIGVALIHLGRFDAAAPHLAAALAVRPGYAVPMMARGWIDVIGGRRIEGERALERALALPDPEPYPRAFFLCRLAEARASRGDLVGARAAIDLAREVARAGGVKASIVEVRNADAALLAQEGKLGDAEGLARAAASDAAALHAAASEAAAWTITAATARRRGDLPAARAALARADALRTAHDDAMIGLGLELERAREVAAGGAAPEAIAAFADIAARATRGGWSERATEAELAGAVLAAHDDPSRRAAAAAIARAAKAGWITLAAAARAGAW